MLKLQVLVFLLISCYILVANGLKNAYSPLWSKSRLQVPNAEQPLYIPNDLFDSVGQSQTKSLVAGLGTHNRNSKGSAPNFKSKLSAASGNDVASEKTRSYQDDIKVTALWVSAAIAFAGFVASTRGLESAVQFASGYVLEQSLSIDNLFVFLVLFDYFKVPERYQEGVLQYGLLGAGVLRAIFIGLGAIVLKQYHEVLLLFAAVLLFSSYKILSGGDDDESEEDLSENPIVKFAKKYLKASDKFDGSKFFTEVNGERLATPLLLCMVCLELSDVVFALDSVPAVFGVTEDPFIVFTSNMFAIGSLRALYGVLSKAVSQLAYLEKAVGVVLGVIAVKMGAETFGYELLSPFQSLVAVLSILSTGIIASLVTRDSKTPENE